MVKAFSGCSLDERFKDYKIIIGMVNRGAFTSGQDNWRTGYEVDYNGEIAAFSYRPLDGHIIIEKRTRDRPGYFPEIVKIFEKDQTIEASKYCKKSLIEHLWKNARIVYGELWNNHLSPYKTDNGKIIALSGFPSYLFPKSRELSHKEKTTRKVRDLPISKWLRINRQRIDRGLKPILEYSTS